MTRGKSRLYAQNGGKKRFLFSFRKFGKKGNLRNKGFFISQKGQKRKIAKRKFLFRKMIERRYESSHSAMSIILIPSTWLSGRLVRAITILG